MLEIERKYLVKKDLWKPKGAGNKIQQGYLAITDKSVVRIRITSYHALLTIKGVRSGISRVEMEYKIPKNEAGILMNMCLNEPVEKIRYMEKVGEFLWEIDVFEGKNKGLILAEVELEDETLEIEFPEWINKEVTEDYRYYNSWLAQNPYTSW